MITKLKLALVVACAAALAAAAPAGAWQPPKAKRMTLAVELTGIHVDRWHVESPGFPKKDQVWVSGTGTQTLGFSTTKPLRFDAMVFSGETPTGEKLPPLTLVPTSAPRPLRGSLRRRGSWHHNDPEVCDREGGCESDDILVPPVHLPPVCPARRVGVPATLAVERLSGSGLSVLAATFESLPLEHAWSNCPPDMDGARRPLALAQPANLGFGGAVAKITRLQPGDEVTLKAHTVRGATDGAPSKHCPELKGPEQQECAVTDLTLEVTRLR